MTKQQKRMFLLNVPYVLMGLFATNLGEAWRIAEGANFSEKLDGIFQSLPIALSSDVVHIAIADSVVNALLAGLHLFDGADVEFFGLRDKRKPLFRQILELDAAGNLAAFKARLKECSHLIQFFLDLLGIHARFGTPCFGLRDLFS